jgi:hypothetical protein
VRHHGLTRLGLQVALATCHALLLTVLRSASKVPAVLLRSATLKEHAGGQVSVHICLIRHPEKTLS